MMPNEQPPDVQSDHTSKNENGNENEDENENETTFGQSLTGVSTSANTIAVVLFGLAIVCAMIAGFFIIFFDTGGTPVDQSPANGSIDSIGVGYAGIVDAQEAEVRDEYNTRSFEERLAHSSSNESRAAVIEAETRRIEARLDRLETRKTTFEKIDDDNRAQVTSFVAQSRVLEQRLDRVQRAAKTLPPSLRAEFGLTEQTFRTLRERRNALTTAEMRELARQIAGDAVGDEIDTEDDDQDDDRNDDDDGRDDDRDDRDDDRDDHGD